MGRTYWEGDSRGCRVEGRQFTAFPRPRGFLKTVFGSQPGPAQVVGPPVLFADNLTGSPSPPLAAWVSRCSRHPSDRWTVFPARPGRAVGQLLPGSPRLLPRDPSRQPCPAPTGGPSARAGGALRRPHRPASGGSRPAGQRPPHPPTVREGGPAPARQAPRPHPLPPRHGGGGRGARGRPGEGDSPPHRPGHQDRAPPPPPTPPHTPDRVMQYIITHRSPQPLP